MLKELEHRMEAKGFEFEWARLREDLDDLEEVRLEAAGRDVLIRSAPRGSAGRAFQAVGVALGPAMRFVEPEVPEAR